MKNRMEKHRELKEKSDKLYERAKHQSENNDEPAESSRISCTARTILCFIPFTPVSLALLVYGFEVISIGGSSYEYEII